MAARNAVNQDLEACRQQVVDTASALVSSGVLSLSLHGNISVRIPGTDTIALTSGGILAGLHTENVALLDLDGKVLGGHLESMTHEIVRMHTEVYKVRSDVGSVIHTHSPYATAFAMANKPLECHYEAMIRLNLTAPVPVAKYGPRGSDEAVRNILAVLGLDTSAMLLQNHGSLVFGADARRALQVAIALEEGARLALLASLIGGPVALPLEMIALARQRADEFQRVGVVSAPTP